MAFWSDTTASPKLTYRWVATLGSFEHKIETYTLKSFQKPSFDITVSEYLDINDVAFKPGILTWKPVEITLIDSEERSVNNTSILYDVIQASGYVKTGGTRYGKPQSAIVKQEASTALGGQIMFDQINELNATIETWTLRNPFISQINFGAANYGADEIMTIAMTIVYDYADYARVL